MPADPFMTLGVPLDATDADIRKRYLELTVQFPPEQHPDRFAAIRAAYEKVRTLDAPAAAESGDPDPLGGAEGVNPIEETLAKFRTYLRELHAPADAPDREPPP